MSEEPLAKRLYRRATDLNTEKKTKQDLENKTIAEKEIPLIKEMNEIVEETGAYELRVPKEFNIETIKNFREKEKMLVYEYCLACGNQRGFRDSCCGCYPTKLGTAFNWELKDQGSSVLARYR